MSNFIEQEMKDILEGCEYLLTGHQILLIKKSLVNAVFAGAMDSSVLEDAEEIGREIGVIDKDGKY